MAESLPACVQPCFTAATGGCSQLDLKCICSSTSFAGYIGSCAANSCPADEQETAFKFVSDLCSANGVTGLSFFVPSATSLVSNLASETATATTTDGNDILPSSASSGTPTSTGNQTTTLESITQTGAQASQTTAQNTTPPPPSGLSTGAKAGIGVGVALGGILFLLGAFFLWRRNRKTKGTAAVNGPEGGTDKEFTISQHNALPVYYEIDGNPQAELADPHGASVAREREGRSELR